jgi:hypothetical protein
VCEPSIDNRKMFGILGKKACGEHPALEDDTEKRLLE